MDFPKKRRGDRSQMYRLFEKDIFMNQKLAKSPTGQPTSVARNIADAVAKTCLCYQ